MPPMIPPSGPPMPGPGPHPGPRPFPYRPYYFVYRPTYCKPVYNNQGTQDALRALLANCKNLENAGVNMCSGQFKNAVQNELTKQVANGVYIGQDCGTNIITTRY